MDETRYQEAKILFSDRLFNILKYTRKNYLSLDIKQNEWKIATHLRDRC